MCVLGLMWDDTGSGTEGGGFSEREKYALVRIQGLQPDGRKKPVPTPAGPDNWEAAGTAAPAGRTAVEELVARQVDLYVFSPRIRNFYGLPSSTYFFPCITRRLSSDVSSTYLVRISSPVTQCFVMCREKMCIKMLIMSRKM